MVFLVAAIMYWQGFLAATDRFGHLEDGTSDALIYRYAIYVPYGMIVFYFLMTSLYILLLLWILNRAERKTEVCEYDVDVK